MARFSIIYLGPHRCNPEPQSLLLYELISGIPGLVWRLRGMSRDVFQSETSSRVQRHTNFFVQARRSTARLHMMPDKHGMEREGLQSPAAPPTVAASSRVDMRSFKLAKVTVLHGANF
mmetsp:Transcript_18671/g.42717  ORF Transcript_18671/g.42717 Transcript_18671/m.42717 type:complete len:118 (-) Transcript_18671:334-687(-)